MKNMLCLIIVLLSVRCYAQSDGTKRKLIWFDEFDYTGLPDSKKWDYETGLIRNKEPQFYTRGRLENARVANGILTIEARKENYQGAAYTSASLITLGKKYFRYGRIEVRAKVAKGKGGWPAIWMLGVNREEVKWPFCGEIDIMEYVGKDSTRVYGTMHYTDKDNVYHYQTEKPVVGKPWEDYHVYAINWTKEKIEFYYDSTCYFVFDLRKADHKKYNPFRKKFYLLLNLALGREGNLGGKLDNGILPLTYQVDYVRVYKQAGSSN